MTALRLLLLAAALAVPIAAQPQGGDSQPRVSVTVSPQTARVGDTVTYSVTVEGGRGTAGGGGDVEAPDASGGLEPVRRTPALDATTSLNGRTERRLAWAYRATSPGAARLGSISVRVGDRVFTTDPVTVTVRAPAAAAPRAVPGDAPPARGVAVRVEPDRRTAVVGQQIVVEVVLYADADAQPTETLALGAWGTPGFWREELDPGVAVPRTVRAGGRARLAYTVERLALFPTRAGRLMIAPRRLRVSLVRFDAPDPGDPFGGLFSPFRQRRETVTVESPAVVVDVMAPPVGAPPSFSGAVGRLTMERRVDRTAVAADEPVQVTVVVAGDGNLATLPAPNLGVPTGVDVFGPDDVRDADRLGERLTATRTFTYTLVPTAGGRLVLPALAWSFYDPSAERYATVTAPAVTVRVVGGAVVASAGPALALQTRARWQRAVPRPWLWAALGLGLAVPVVAAAGGWARRRRRTVPTPALTPVVTGGTYAETERGLREVFAARFGVPPATPADRLPEALVAAGVEADVAVRLGATVAACERGQYAPGLPGTPPPAVLAADATAALAALTPPARRRRATLTAAACLLSLTATAQPEVGASQPEAGTRHPQGEQPTATADALFRRGVQLVAEGDTAGAVAAWQGARDAGAASGRASAAVEHNLGLVALAQGDAGRACLHLERAARLAPLDAPTRAALADTRGRVGAPPPSRAAQAWAVATATATGPVALVALAIGLASIATALALRTRRRGALTFGAAAALAAVVAIAALTEAPRSVVTEDATVRTAPSPDAPEAGRLPAGAAVRVGEKAAGWHHVRGDGVTGWAPAEAVAE